MRSAGLVVIVAAVASANADPQIHIGERRFVGGRAVTAIAVCNEHRALSVEMWGPRTYAWSLPGGELAGTLGALDAEQMFVACEGDLALTGNFDGASLYKGTTLVAHAKLKDALGGTITGGRAYVVAGAAVYELTAAGAKEVWKGSGSAGLRAVVRADLVVTAYSTELVWSTPAKTTRLTLPAEATAIGDLGYAIAVADKRGDVRLLTGPTLPAPVLSVDPDKLGAIRSVGGNRAWLAAGTYEAMLVQQSRKTGKTLAPLELVPERMSRALLAIAIAGDRWLVGTDDHRIVPVALGATTFTRPPIAGHDNLIWAIAFDDTALVTGASDETVRVHARDGKLVRVLANPDARPYPRVGLGAGLVWARDDYGHLQRWNRTTGKALPTIEPISDAAALDAKRLAVVQRGTLGVLDLATGAIHPVANAPAKLDSGVKLAAAADLVAIAPDFSGGPVRIVDVKSGSVVAALAVGEVDALAFTADGSRLAITSERKIQIWTRKDRKLAAAGEHPTRVSALAFARDGRLASGDWNGTIRIWKPGTGKPASELVAHHGRIDALVWNAAQLASAASDYQVKVWDIAP
jgi:hypothetical protein